jgi:CBS domain-containing protein
MQRCISAFVNLTCLRREALEILVRFSGAPVEDASGKIVGVLSDSDMLWRTAGLPDEAWEIPPIMQPVLTKLPYISWSDKPDSFRDEVHRLLTCHKVGEAMTKVDKIQSVKPSTPLQEYVIYAALHAAMISLIAASEPRSSCARRR